VSLTPLDLIYFSDGGIKPKSRGGSKEDDEDEERQDEDEENGVRKEGRHSVCWQEGRDGRVRGHGRCLLMLGVPWQLCADADCSSFALIGDW
jgi:hypothetical protein